mgnify:CR=1 FL=1
MLYYKGFRLPHRINEHVQNVVEFELLSPNNEIIKGINLSKFCKENYLKYNCIRKVINGSLWEYRGWRRTDTTDEELSTKGQKYKKSLTLISPNGDEIYVDDLKPFCFKNKLNYKLFYNLYKGFNKMASGWTTKENFRDVSKQIINTDGKIVRLIGRGSIKKFCNHRNLNYDCFIHIMGDKEKQYKGWRLLE